MLKVSDINLLNFRTDTGKILSTSKNPIRITKKGQVLGIVLTPNLADDFFKWQEETELKEIYFNARKSLAKIGQQVLKENKISSEKFAKMSDLEILNLVD
jgi:hypothetical protein